MTNETLVSSDPFIGKWRGLVSTTNWEKGRIIQEWRLSMIDCGAPVSEYSDETWSQLVDSVTPQHVGRLRRVFEKFGEQAGNYEGLYWSHFHAAIDWEDAEMWLEGAVQNGWSVSKMRHQRWETLGSISDEEPSDDQIISSEVDEDAPHESTVNVKDDPLVASSVHTVDDYDRRAGGNDEEDVKDESAADDEEDEAGHREEVAVAGEAMDPVRPFADLPELPEDVHDAFENYKLAIVRHRMDGWQAISKADMVTSLRSLIQLAEAPADPS